MNPQAIPLILTNARAGVSVALRLVIAIVLSGCVATTPARYWDTGSMLAGVAVQLSYKDEIGGKKVAGIVNRSEIDSFRGVVNRISSAASQRVDKILLSDQDQANASAGFDKNGNAVVTMTLKMLRLLQNDTDALAALIGHEIGHLAKRHGDSRQQVQGAATAVSTIVGVLLGRVGVPMGGTLSDIGAQVVTTAYTRDQEREADEFGIRIAHVAGYDPAGAVRLFQILEAANKTFSIPFLSSHPSSDERIGNMEKLVNEVKK